MVAISGERQRVSSYATSRNGSGTRTVNIATLHDIDFCSSSVHLPPDSILKDPLPGS